MPPVNRHPPRSTSTAFWLCNSSHSSPGSFVAGWYMISLNTTTLSPRAEWPVHRKTAVITDRRIGEENRRFMEVDSTVRPEKAFGSARLCCLIQSIHAPPCRNALESDAVAKPQRITL